MYNTRLGFNVLATHSVEICPHLREFLWRRCYSPFLSRLRAGNDKLRLEHSRIGIVLLSNPGRGALQRRAGPYPRFNASAWADLEANPDPEQRVIAFMVDVETCIESDYPVSGAVSWKVNMEPGHPELMIKRAATSPALKANPDSRLVILDCSGVEKVRIQLTYYRWVWGRSSTWGYNDACTME